MRNNLKITCLGSCSSYKSILLVIGALIENRDSVISFPINMIGLIDIRTSLRIPYSFHNCMETWSLFFLYHPLFF